MKKNRIFKCFLTVVFFVFLISGIGSIQAQNRTRSLEDCINYAIENNIQVKQSELNIKASEVDLLQSKLDMLPDLNGRVNYSYSWGRVLDQTNYVYNNIETKQASFNLDASITLFAGLQKLNTVKKSKIDFLSSKYAADKMKDDISLMLTQAYLSILFNKELLRVAREQVDITQEQIDRTSKMVEAGTLARGSLLEIQAQGAAEEISVINYENSLELAYLDLLQILDLPADTDFEIIVPDLDMELTMEILQVSDVYEFALMNQPSIKSSELDVESSYKSVSIAKGNMSPVLSLSTGWGTNYSDQSKKPIGYNPVDSTVIWEGINFGDQFADHQNRYLALSLNIPIFNGYQTSSNIARAKINAANAEYNLELSKNSLRKVIEQSYSDAKAANKSYAATQKSLSSFEESFRYTEQKFNVGLSNSVDYNISKSQLTAAESELIRAKYDYIFRAKILDFYMGKPLTLNN
nr:TolC family protein [Bacteroidota bacterium]